MGHFPRLLSPKMIWRRPNDGSTVYIISRVYSNSIRDHEVSTQPAATATAAMLTASLPRRKNQADAPETSVKFAPTVHTNNQ